jgi:hypothetical protein
MSQPSSPSLSRRRAGDYSIGSLEVSVSNRSINAHASAVCPAARSASASRRCPRGVAWSRQAARASAKVSAAGPPVHRAVRAASRSSQALTATRIGAVKSAPQRVHVVTPRQGARQVGQRKSMTDCELWVAELFTLTSDYWLVVHRIYFEELIILRLRRRSLS